MQFERRQPREASDGVDEEGELDVLTPRQVEVVGLAVLGLTAKESARRLKISKNTVDEHLREARLRAGTATKAGLVAWAVASGLVCVPEPRGGSVHHAV